MNAAKGSAFFQCLFCRSSETAFKRFEHPIPESFGNDDLTLKPGYVCDNCNEYFGSKVERQVAAAPPFAVERVRAGLKTKHGKQAKFESTNVNLYSTGYWDHVVFAASLADIISLKPRNMLLSESGGYLFLDSGPRDQVNIVRLLLKMGLELLLSSGDIDPYSAAFDTARKFSRYAPKGSQWDLGYALYPDKDDLVIATREDEISPLITQTLYQYSIGQMLSGDIGICFVYRTHVFAANLARSSLREYVSAFNTMNHFQMKRTVVRS